jgi:hypothetical protein
LTEIYLCNVCAEDDGWKTHTAPRLRLKTLALAALFVVSLEHAARSARAAARSDDGGGGGGGGGHGADTTCIRSEAEHAIYKAESKFISLERLSRSSARSHTHVSQLPSLYPSLALSVSSLSGSLKVRHAVKLSTCEVGFDRNMWLMTSW